MDEKAVEFYSVMGKEREKMKMTEELGSKEQIEIWLECLEKIMKDTVKKFAGRAAMDVRSDGSNKMETDLDNFLKTTPAQCALMGMQM